MPITKSAKKSLRSSLAKNKRNDSLRKNLEIKLKKVTPATLSQVVSTIDKAAKRHLLHPNKAARLKSRLAKTVGVKGVAKRPGAGATLAKKSKGSKSSSSRKSTANSKQNQKS